MKTDVGLFIWPYYFSKQIGQFCTQLVCGGGGSKRDACKEVTPNDLIKYNTLCSTVNRYLEQM